MELGSYNSFNKGHQLISQKFSDLKWKCACVPTGRKNYSLFFKL